MSSRRDQIPKSLDFSRRHPWHGADVERNRVVLSRANDLLLRRAIVILGLACGSLFAMLFVFSYTNPISLEKWARKAISQEVQKRIASKIDGLDNLALARELPSRIAVIMDRMAHPECPCRVPVESYEPIRLGDQIARLAILNAKMAPLIESGYHDVAQSLLFELRVFSGANAVTLMLLALIAWMWKRPALQLLPPAIVLIGALALTANIYLFKQDWLQSILLGDYVGLLYVPYLLLATGFMIDVVFLRATLSLGLFGIFVPRKQRL